MKPIISIFLLTAIAGCKDSGVFYHTKERAGTVVCINGSRATITNEVVSTNRHIDNRVYLLFPSGIETVVDTGLTKECE